ncbi:TAM domain methyltransferase [Colletotrichum higginsianum IMI 349063]|uniref:TAM domain methyltransferase n=1 Tax=Colletotrichum higginsianum (strain IMI 349063) TaxID=759273 RepID=A0A1B7Y1A3_COLHI|nr:TAM domain methyltransferase [Colletotrichum higginsianum IMI 349063]OBR05803.1 TAM domain methyltransferase [Colletotrichum higginsianum IMI 349063]
MSELVARVSSNNTPAPPESNPPAQPTLDEGGDDAGDYPQRADDESALGSVTWKQYLTPNDERELDRLDLEHNMFLRTFGNRLGTAPPNEEKSNEGRVLDAGTGTGIWAIDFGDEHPDAEVIGVDLLAIWPDYMPMNVRFEIDDLEGPWVFSQPFNYIHSQTCRRGLPIRPVTSRSAMIDKVSNLAPGGYLEMNEVDLFPQSDDGTIKDDSAILESTRLLHECSTIFGRSPLKLEDRTKTMTNAHYKEWGAWCHDDLVARWEGVCMALFTRALKWPKEEVIVFKADVRKEFVNKQIHPYFSVWSVYGRKPSTPKSPAVA